MPTDTASSVAFDEAKDAQGACGAHAEATPARPPQHRSPGEVKRSILELHQTIEEATHAWNRRDFRHAEHLCKAAATLMSKLERLGAAWIERRSLVDAPAADRERFARRIAVIALRHFREYAVRGVEHPAKRPVQQRPGSPEEAWTLLERLLDQAHSEALLQAQARAGCHELDVR